MFFFFLYSVRSDPGATLAFLFHLLNCHFLVTSHLHVTLPLAPARLPDGNASASSQPGEKGGTEPPLRRRAATPFQHEGEPPRAVESAHVPPLLQNEGGLSGARAMIPPRYRCRRAANSRTARQCACRAAAFCFFSSSFSTTPKTKADERCTYALKQFC